MRISDWSSDVCSSDLHLSLQRHVGHQSQIGFGIEPRHVACIGIAVGIAVRHVEIEDELVAVGNGFAHSSSPSSLLSAARSEEHTSELQSLMRISYAVFCLNKKNGNKNNI